jgi:hypothetical protein
MLGYRWILATALVVTASPVHAGSAEDEAFSAFEWFCLSQLHDPSQVGPLFSGIGIEPLSDEFARPLLSGMRGKVWALPGDHTNIVVALTEDAVCQASALYVEAGPVVELLIEKLRISQVHEEEVGSTKTLYYAVTFPHLRGGDDQHALVTAAFQTLGSSEGIILTSMPEGLLIRDGVNRPKWPD